mgnify:CR=1 FL=1
MVVHCGSSFSGEYVNTVNTTDISYGWWEGDAIIGRSQEYRKAYEEKRKSHHVELSAKYCFIRLDL